MPITLKNLNSIWNRYYQQCIAVFFTCLGLYFRYKALVGRSLWLDETNQFNNTVGPLKPFWQRLSYCELTSFPGEYLLCWPFVQIFGMNKWGINIPHILSAILGFFLFYLVCKRYLKSKIGWIIAFSLLCFHRELIFHGFEFRPYAVLPTLSLACFYFSEDIVDRIHVLSKIKQFFIGVLFVSIIVYHAYGAMIVFFCMLFFMSCALDKREVMCMIKDLSPFLIMLALVAIPLFLWYATGNKGINILDASTNKHNYDVFRFIPNPVIDIIGFLKGVFCNLVGNKKFYFLFGILPVACILPTKERDKQVRFFFLLVLIPILFKLTLDVSKGYWFLQRQFVWIMPLFCFYIGWCWDSVVLYFLEKFNEMRAIRNAE